jgi:hypothetical protein
VFRDSGYYSAVQLVDSVNESDIRGKRPWGNSFDMGQKIVGKLLDRSDDDSLSVAVLRNG